MKSSKIKNNFRKKNNNKSLKRERNFKKILSSKRKRIILSYKGGFNKNSKSKLKKKKRYLLKGGTDNEYQLNPLEKGWNGWYKDGSFSHSHIQSNFSNSNPKSAPKSAHNSYNGELKKTVHKKDTTETEEKKISSFNDGLLTKLREIFKECANNTSPELETQYNKTDKLTDWKEPKNIDNKCETISDSGNFGYIVPTKFTEDTRDASNLEDVIVKFTHSTESIAEDELIRELAITLYIGDHDNIANVKGYARIKTCNVEYCILSKEKCCPCESDNYNSFFGIVMTQYSQNLHTYLKSKHDFKHHKSIIKDVGEGLKFLHKKHILHFDIHTKNILLTETKKAKITDFGISLLIKPNNQFEWPFWEERKKTMNKSVIPPELVYNKNTWITAQNLNTSKIDVWSFGTLIYELLTCKKLYLVIIKKNPMFFMSPEPRADEDFITEIIEEIQHIKSTGWEEILNNCLEFDNSKRKLITQLNFDDLDEITGSSQCKDNIDIVLADEYIDPSNLIVKVNPTINNSVPNTYNLLADLQNTPSKPIVKNTQSDYLEIIKSNSPPAPPTPASPSVKSLVPAGAGGVISGKHKNKTLGVNHNANNQAFMSKPKMSLENAAKFTQAPLSEQILKNDELYKLLFREIIRTTHSGIKLNTKMASEFQIYNSKITDGTLPKDTKLINTLMQNQEIKELISQEIKKFEDCKAKCPLDTLSANFTHNGNTKRYKSEKCLSKCNIDECRELYNMADRANRQLKRNARFALWTNADWNLNE
jgi:serine/threonine protein kinase